MKKVQRVVARTDEFVEVSTRYPLWAAVPANLRVTEDDICRAHRGEPYRQEHLDGLRNPRCAVAVTFQPRPSRLAPCHNQPAEGDLCGLHGGPTRVAPPTKTSRLRAEVEALREEVARLRAEPQPLA